MKYQKLVLLAVLCLFAAGCSAMQQRQATSEASTEWRLKSLEESFLNFREEQRRQADVIEADKTETDGRIASLEEEVAALKAGGAVVDNAADTPDDMKDEAGRGWVTDLKPEPEEWVEGDKKAEESMAQSAEEKPWNKVPGPPPVVPEPKVVKRDKPASKAARAQPAPKKIVVPASRAAYDSALALYEAGKFSAARDGFTSFVKRFPKSELVPNALYWKGETYYSEKNYAQSILAFKEVTGQYPKHAKAAAALLKIGMSYERVGDPDNAVFYLRALVEDFPDSSPAKLARKELSRLGG